MSYKTETHFDFSASGRDDSLRLYMHASLAAYALN